MDLQVGDAVWIRDNGRIHTHITPRWALGDVAEVIRLNDRSLTVRLLHRERETIRVDYADAIRVRWEDVHPDLIPPEKQPLLL